MVAAVSDHKVAFRVKRNATAAVQLTRAAALAAEAAQVRAVAQPQHLNAAVAAPIVHDDIAVADYCGGPRLVHLALTTTEAADSSQKEAIGISGNTNQRRARAGGDGGGVEGKCMGLVK